MYNLDWNSEHPGHVVFLLDLSESMKIGDRIGHAVEALRQTLQLLGMRCQKLEGDTTKLKDRISVSIYGYNSKVKCLGNIQNWGPAQFIAFAKAARKAGRPIFDYGENGEAKPEWQTCMCAAFQEAKRDIEQWLSQQRGPEIPAPIVINITDGHPNDGKQFDQDEVFDRTLRAAKDLMNIRTNDGPVRVFNIHYKPGSNSNVAPLRFPKIEPTDQDPTNERILQFLYNASSPITAEMAKSLKNDFSEVAEGSHAMISNEFDARNLLAFLKTASQTGMSNR